MSDYDAFLEAVQAANADLPNRFYIIDLMAETITTIDREISLGDNASLGVNSPLVIAESGSLSVSVEMIVYNHPATINGSLTNTGVISIPCWEGFNASLSLGETGSYSGTGVIEIYGDAISSPDEVLPGFDLTKFGLLLLRQ